MDKTNLTLPTLHLNGTGKRMLMEGYSEARTAVIDAIGAIQRIEFNARDYYPQGPEAWKKATEQMHDRQQKLSEVADELLAIMEHIQDAPGGR